MKRSIYILLSAWLLSGCGDTPSDQQPSDAADQPEDAEVEESALVQVPRNRTLIMDCAESGHVRRADQRLQYLQPLSTGIHLAHWVQFRFRAAVLLQCL